MSLISGLVTLPGGQVFQIYKNAYWQFPIVERTYDAYGLEISAEIVLKGDPRYAELLHSLPGPHIKGAMEPFLDQVGIRKDLIFAETPNIGFCSAAGTDVFTKGDAAILIAPGLYEADKEICSWLMKHEISHIKHNDNITVLCVAAICQLAASIFGMRFLSFWPAWGLAATVGFVSNSLFSQWREAKADDFAIENSSDEELKGGRRYLRASQEECIEERNTFWKRLLISASGNIRLDIDHPSLTSRIQKIERVLRSRNIEIDEATEREKLSGFKKYMADKQRELEQSLEQDGGVSRVMLREMWAL